MTVGVYCEMYLCIQICSLGVADLSRETKFMLAGFFSWLHIMLQISFQL